MQDDSSTASSETDEAIRDRVIFALRDAVRPWMSGEDDTRRASHDPSREFRVVNQAEQLMAQWDPNQRLNVGQLAAELEVSQRALYEAFRRLLGMGPYEFHLLRKMHEFRELLLDGGSFHGKIKQVAEATGFRHLGRLTQSYRRHFGESPRETMKRRKSERS
jgi:AraC family ethanolamine operon transcriptional activator